MKRSYIAHRGRIGSERGSALIIVVMLCVFTLILIGSYLASLSDQSRIVQRATLQNEARNAAEGMAEYALAEANRRADANPSFGASANPDVLTGYSLPAANLAFIASGTANNHVVGSEVAFKNSVLSNAPSSPMLIDAGDPINLDDPNKGDTLSVRSFNIFGKAAVLDPSNNTLITSYVAENVQVREQAWFNYAIFYNMDLEFHAGPNFSVLGPVHTNANVYLTEGDGATLKFFSNLGAVGQLFRYDKYTSNRSGGHGGTVQCISAPGMIAANLKTMATNEDSTNVNFYTVAKTKWNSFVQDKTFTVKKFNPPGLPAYVPEDFATISNELRNTAYLMIEPQLSNRITDPDYGQKVMASENLKFSALSSFVIQIEAPASIGAQPKWKLVVYQATDPSYPISASNPPARDTLTGKPIVALSLDPFDPIGCKDDSDYPADYPALGDRLATIKRGLRVALLDAVISVPYQDEGTVPGVSWGNGSKTSTLSLFHAAAPANSTTTYYPLYDRREGYNYPGNSSSATRGLYGAMHVLMLDLGKLKALLNDTDVWKKPYGSTAYVYNPATTYTGVVYVQFPLAPITTSRFPSPVGSVADGDQIRPAQAATSTTPGYAVVLKNGMQVPQLSGGSPDGFTVATNGPLYVWSHFNADGNSSTGSSTTPDSGTEVPALIAADSVTILSANNNFANMPQGVANASSFTEVSAAIIAGLVPTKPGTGNIWAGGVHNLVRFLENWSGSSYRYRGSIAVLYESEVAKSAYREGYNGFFYGAPTRDMGYHQYLSQGRFPPATPIKRTIRRMNLQDILAAEYNAGPQKPAPVN